MYRTCYDAVYEAEVERENANNIPAGEIPLDKLPTYVEPYRLVMKDFSICDVCKRMSATTSVVYITYHFGLKACQYTNCQNVLTDSIEQFRITHGMYDKRSGAYKVISEYLTDDVKFFRERINGVQDARLSDEPTCQLSSNGSIVIAVNTVFKQGEDTCTKNVPLRNVLRHTLTREKLTELIPLVSDNPALTKEIEEALA